MDDGGHQLMPRLPSGFVVTGELGGVRLDCSISPFFVRSIPYPGSLPPRRFRGQREARRWITAANETLARHRDALIDETKAVRDLARYAPTLRVASLRKRAHNAKVAAEKAALTATPAADETASANA